MAARTANGRLGAGRDALTAPTPFPFETLAHLTGWRRTEVTTLRELGGSQTNRSFLLDRRGVRYVLRVDTPLAARLGLNRETEIVVREIVAAAGLAPRLLASDRQAGIMLSRYQSGRTWTAKDLLDARHLALLGRRLKALYTLTPDAPALNWAHSANCYAERVGSEQARAKAVKIGEQLAQICGDHRSICHGDLVAQNLIHDEQLWLIDWEYAGVSDPLLDLAVIIEHHALPPSVFEPFVRASVPGYGCRDPADLGRYRRVYRLLAELWRDAWSVISDGGSTPASN